jgi:hypothetical protein
MTVLATLGANALWMLYLWLGSAVVASELSKRKGYGEKIGLGTGLLLSAVGVVIWLLVPPRDDSPWRRRRAQKAAAAAKVKADAE